MSPTAIAVQNHRIAANQDIAHPTLPKRLEKILKVVVEQIRHISANAYGQ